MTRLLARVSRLERHRFRGAAVARFVNKIRRCSDEELFEFVEGGEFNRQAARLGDRQLDQLIAELEAMTIKEGGG